MVFSHPSGSEFGEGAPCHTCSSLLTPAASAEDFSNDRHFGMNFKKLGGEKDVGVIVLLWGIMGKSFKITILLYCLVPPIWAPSRKLTYPTLGKRLNSLQKCLGIC